MAKYGRYFVSDHDITPNYLEGMVAMGEHRLEDALSILRREPRDSPCYGLALGNIALVLLRLDHFSEAESVARESLEEISQRGCPNPPSEVQFHRNLAEAIARQGRWAEAIEDYNRASERADNLARLHPKHEAALLLEKAHGFASLGNTNLHREEWGLAIDQYNLARQTYEAYPEDDRVGHAEVLTNMAYALMHRNRRLEADLALSEALSIAEATGDDDQVFRVRNVAYQLNSSVSLGSEALDAITTSAEAALDDHRYATAHVRFCIGAACAFDEEEPDTGLSLLQRARAIERHLEPRDPNIPRLRTTEASLLEMKEEPSVEIIRVLIEGASRWYTTIAAKLIDEDFRIHARSLHSHFRMLASYLLDAGRVEDAVMTFESSRALHHSVTVDPSFFSRAISVNPFAADGSSIDTRVFREARSTLNAGEVALVLAHIPPQLVAFLIDNQDIRVVTEELPRTQEELDRLDLEIGMIPHRLGNRVGKTAIPEQFVRMADGIVGELKGRRLRGFTPYGRFHLIPWRTLLREANASWEQLAFPISFSFLLRVSNSGPVHLAGSPLFALACGGEAGTDFHDEAEACVQAFGDPGHAVRNCRGSDFTSALSQPGIALLSCHGVAHREEMGVSTRFQLYDEHRTVIVATPDDQVVPRVVQSVLVILSACESGVYEMAWGDEPAGAAPLLLHRGARFCIGTRFPIGVMFAGRFFPRLMERLAGGEDLVTSFWVALSYSEQTGADRWKDIACPELITR